jgi:anti-sigma factor RsiW
MTQPNAPKITDAELHAWVDDQLACADRARVEAALQADPALRALAEHYAAQNAALRRMLAEDATDPPAALLETARAPGSGRTRLRRVAGLAAAVLLGAAVGWLGRGAVPAGSPLQRAGDPVAAPSIQPVAPALPLARAAAVAHAAYAPEVRHPVEVGADDEAHLVAWLSKRLGATLRVPDLRAAGLSLVGGRLLPDPDGGVAALFMFEDVGGRRTTLFVRRDAGGQDVAFRYARADGVSSFYWIDRGFGYALSGDLPREAMLSLATAVHAQLNQ